MRNAISAKSAKNFLLLTTGYFVVGRLALLLAIPPGYATAIWPAAGVALAGIYLLGNRYWPAIALGSALVNIDTAIVMGQGWQVLLQSISTPLLIGLGASAQAVFGSFLIKRYIPGPLALDDFRSVSRYLILVCGLASVVSATVGTTLLYLNGAIVAENLLYNWFTWWVGDGLGVMLVAVLVFTFWAEPRAIWKVRRPVLPVIILGTGALIVLLYLVVNRSEWRRQQSEFESRSTYIYQIVSGALNRYQESLFVAASAIQFGDPQNPEQFHRLVGGIIERNPGFQGIAWNVPVFRDERRNFESRLSADYGQHLVLTQVDDNGSRMLAEERDQYVAIRFIEPIVGNEPALGFDISSNEVARLALMRAMETRQPAATEPTRLIQESGDQTGVVVYFPVYRGLADGTLPAGFLSGVFRIEALINVIVGNISGPELSYSLKALQSSKLLFQHRLGTGKASSTPFFRKQWQITFADREWLLEVAGDQSFWAQSRSPVIVWAVLAGGMLFTGLLGVSLLVFTGQHYRTKAAGDELRKTLSALSEAQDQLVEAEKMASLGGMVAGFAHELNTPVGIVITAISTLKNDIEQLSERLDTRSEAMPPAQIQSILQRVSSASEIALNSAQRAGNLVTSFKQVSIDQAKDESRDINLNEYFADLIVHLEGNCRRHGHRLSWNCPRDINIVSIPSGITQVVYNLLQNSLDHAFGQGEAGEISIAVSQREGGVVIVYKDDGVGIAPEIVGRIFDPFFTTRRGEGRSGLGLHLVYNIVRQQLRGKIEVSSTLGQGVVFTLHLPNRID